MLLYSLRLLSLILLLVCCFLELPSPVQGATPSADEARLSAHETNYRRHDPATDSYIRGGSEAQTEFGRSAGPPNRFGKGYGQPTADDSVPEGNARRHAVKGKRQKPTRRKLREARRKAEEHPAVVKNGRPRTVQKGYTS